MFTSRSKGGRSETSRPSRRIRPSVGRSNPAIIRRQVVLPEPEGPSREKNSPCAHVQADAVHRDDVAEALDHVLQRDGRRGPVVVRDARLPLGQPRTRAVPPLLPRQRREPGNIDGEARVPQCRAQPAEALRGAPGGVGSPRVSSPRIPGPGRSAPCRAGRPSRRRRGRRGRPRRVEMPPQATIGTARPVAAATSETIRGVSSLRGPPERPPRPAANRGSSTGIVFEQTSPRAPASIGTAASARTDSRSSSLVNGGSFSSTGRSVRRGRPPAGSPMWPHRAPGGVRTAGVQLEPVDVGGKELDGLARRIDVLVRDACETWRRPPGSSQVAAAASAPGFGSPIEFTIAPRRGERTILGFGFPFRGARVIGPPTTNPNPSRPSASR